MRVKPIILGILILAVVALALFTQPMYDLIGTSGVTLPGLLTLITPQSGEYRQILLIANKDALSGQNFPISNSTVETSGLCIGLVNVFGANLQMDRRCDIRLDQGAGQMAYSTIGTIEASTQAVKAEIDGQIFTPTNNKKVSFSILPNDLLLTDLSLSKLTLSSVTGEIKRYKADGSEDQVKNLNNEKVEITNFRGTISLSKNTIVLNGFATKVNWFV